MFKSKFQQIFNKIIIFENFSTDYPDGFKLLPFKDGARWNCIHGQCWIQYETQPWILNKDNRCTITR